MCKYPFGSGGKRVRTFPPKRPERLCSSMISSMKFSDLSAIDRLAWSFDHCRSCLPGRTLLTQTHLFGKEFAQRPFVFFLDNGGNALVNGWVVSMDCQGSQRREAGRRLVTSEDVQQEIDGRGQPGHRNRQKNRFVMVADPWLVPMIFENDK